MVYCCHNQGCRKTFKYRESRKRHMDNDCTYERPLESAVKFQLNASGRYECLGCLKTFAYKNGVQKHIRDNRCKHEKVAESFPCLNCGKKFQYESKLKEHNRMHERSMFECGKCLRKFKRQDFYKKHIEKCNCLENASFVQPTFLYSASTPKSGLSSASSLMPCTDFTSSMPHESVIDTSIPLLHQDSMEDPIHLSEDISESSGTQTQKDDSQQGYQTITPMKETEEEICHISVASSLNKSAESPRSRKSKSRNLKSLHGLLHKVQLKHRRKILEEALTKQTSEAAEEIAFSGAENIFQGKVCSAFLNYLKSLKRNSICFYKLLNDSFGEDLDDEEFLRFLGRKLDIWPHLLRSRLQSWIVREFKESRGRKSLNLEQQQVIYNLWLEYSIPSVDSRNNRNCVKMNRQKYERRYNDLENNGYQVKLKANKRGADMYEAPRRVATCTVRIMQKKIKEKLGINVSLGLTLNLKPFFVVKPTDKEKEMCLCKFCLNLRLSFNALMEHSKKFDGPFFESISSFYMNSCGCQKAENGYWKLDCCLGKCQDCRSKENILIPNVDSGTKISYYKFEVTKTSYLSKKTNTIKECKRTERVNVSQDVKALLQDIYKLKEKYLLHRYQVENDRMEWRKIIETNHQFGPLFHLDYSENVSGTPKFEPQDAHFSKRQFSLHCTVVHFGDKEHHFLYHLSDDLTHGWCYTEKVVEDIIKMYPDAQIYRFKFDNCSPQYKSLNIFPIFLRLAALNKKIIIGYYGVKGHGKGLVDAMSGFGLKTPLRRAIVTSDIFFDNAETVHKYFVELMGNDSSKIYRLIEGLEHGEHDQLEIKGCQKLHMIAYFPNGDIQIKENMCSCDKCLVGKFVQCNEEKGKLYKKGNADDASSDSEDYSLGDNESDSGSDDEFVNVDSILNGIDPGSYIGIYSSENANELFYLCLVRSINRTPVDITDRNNHFVPAGSVYAVCSYLEKVSENHRQKKIQYKLLPESEVFVLHNQIFCPCVNLESDLGLDLQEYLWLSDCI